MIIEEFISGLCTVPFVLLYPYGTIITINGLLCHMSASFDLPYQNTFLILDIISNFVIGGTINIYTNYYPQTQIITLFSVYMWYNNRKNHSVLNHVLFVMAPLFYGLYKY